MSNEITVLICARNAEKYISEAISSAKRQTLQANEILVIDDNSNDSTSSIARNFGARVLKNTGLGLASARNFGFKNASNELIFVLDSDDLMTGKALEIVYSKMKNDNLMMGVFGKRQNFISPELSKTIRNKKTNNSYLPEYAPIVAGSLWRRSLIQKIQFDSRFLACDVEWLLQIRKHNSIITNVEELIYLRRLHLDNMSHRKDVVKLGYLNIARQQIIERK
jgi:glycosyltransferase involved in cell wall biosynthesis